jgi:hypothetical protein
LVDTSIYPDKSDFTLNLLNPIIITEKERLRFKLINFSSLNNIYNISSELNNNTINLKRYKKLLLYVQNPDLSTSPIITEADVAPYYEIATSISPLLYKPKDQFSRHMVYNQIAGINFYAEEITLANYTLYLRDGRITAANSSPATLYFYNMFFNDNPINDIAFMIPFFNQSKVADKWFIITKPSGFLDQINRVEIDLHFHKHGHNNPDAGTITIYVTSVNFSNGNITIIGSKTETYTPSQMLADNTRRITINITYTPNTPFNTYLIYCDSSGFKTHARDQFYFKKLNIIRNNFGYFQESGDVILDQDINMTIPDGIYGASNLVTKINNLLTENAVINTKISLQSYNYKLLVTNTDITTGLLQYDFNNRFVFTFPDKLGSMLGFNNVIVNRLTSVEADNSINLLNFQKYLITSSMKMRNPPELFLKDDEYRNEGIGDVVAIINKDIPAFQYINYINLENISYDIDNKVIHNINFKLLNEFKQRLPSMPSATFQFQLIKVRSK